MKRKKFFQTTLMLATLSGISGRVISSEKSNINLVNKLKGNINHSVCRWCYDKFSLDKLLPELKKIGINALDLVGPNDWNTLKKYDIYSSMCNGAEISLTEGWNNKNYHKELIKRYSEMIPLVSKAGYKNLICFSGNRNGMDSETGMNNCVEGLKVILSLAEKNNVIIQMELFNSKLNHPDYMCDSSKWGVELCKKLGSPNFKLLYDIYHMQVQEGDIIQTIKDFHPFFGHYHTAGVPGRNEIDNTQELNYTAIMNAIKDIGFKGFVAQEFIPKKEDQIQSLVDAIKVCDV